MSEKNTMQDTNCKFDKYKNTITFGMLFMAVLVFSQMIAIICLFFRDGDKSYSFSIDKPQMHIHHYNDNDTDMDVDDGTLGEFVDMDADVLHFEEVMAKTFPNQDKVVPKCNHTDRPGRHWIKQQEKPTKDVKKVPEKQPKVVSKNPVKQPTKVKKNPNDSRVKQP